MLGSLERNGHPGARLTGETRASPGRNSLSGLAIAAQPLQMAHAATQAIKKATEPRNHELSRILGMKASGLSARAMGSSGLRTCRVNGVVQVDCSKPAVKKN